MFHLLHKSKLDQINLNHKRKNHLLNNYLQKHPIKRAEFSSLKKKNERIINSIENNTEIKINYTIEDTRYFEGLLIVLTSIGTIFLYEIYSKKLKKIICFATEELRAKGIHINSIRKSFIVTLFSFINNINNIQCLEIPFSHLLNIEKIKVTDFIRILKSEEFLDSECYVQFDEYNKVILTRNILRTNKIWNFEKYSKNLEFTYSNLNEIRLTGGACLVCEKTNELKKYNIHIFDVNNGKKLYVSEIFFIPDKKIIFFELLKNYLFIKQQGNYPLYIDLITKNIKIIKEQIDNDALFMYSGNTNKFIIVSLDRYLIFDINGDLLKKVINNNLSIEIKQNDIFSPINNYPFVICWHLANVSYSNSESSLRGRNSVFSSLSNISLNDSNNNNNSIINKKKKNNDSIFEGQSGQDSLSHISPIANERNNINSNNIINFSLYSPLSNTNLNNIGFIENKDNIEDKYSINGLYGEHQIDIIYMDDVNYIRSINFKIDFNQSINSINFIQETNSVFIITCFGEIYEIKL